MWIQEECLETDLTYDPDHVRRKENIETPDEKKHQSGTLQL